MGLHQIRFKENNKIPFKNSTTQENIRISKKAMKFVQKENFEPKIKPMIENLQNAIYQLENKQAKGAKLHGNIRQELEGEKGSKTFFRILEIQNMQIQAIFK